MGATRNARMLCAGFSAALLVAFASPAHSLPPDEKHGGPITGTGHGSVTTCMQTDQSLVGGNGGTELQMVAIGDSYVWGNGLRSADKFRTLVQQQLSQSLQRPVRSVVYAHSDATLKPDSSLTNAPRPGDVGGSYPTIEQQADCVPNPANVDFILMDGCINDLPAFNIADPTAPPESIAKQVASKCLPMAEVLAKILARFPKARVVLVGYHLLYSEQTPADLLPSVYRHLDVSAISPLL